jgi:hypothetical protein
MDWPEAFVYAFAIFGGMVFFCGWPRIIVVGKCTCQKED